MAFFSENNQVFVNNASSERYYVYVGPNSDWKLVDLGFEVFTAVASLTNAKFTWAKSLEKVQEAGNLSFEGLKFAFKILGIGNNVKKIVLGGVDIWSTLSKSGIKVTEEAVKQVQEQSDAARKYLARNLIVIEPGAHKRVLWDTVSDKWGKVSNLASNVFGAGDVAMFAVNDSLTHVTQFAFNSDQSWLIRDDGMVSVEHGTLDKPEPDKGLYRFPTYVHPSTLLVDVPLTLGQSIVSDNGRYSFLFQKEDGNAVIYDAHENKPTFATRSSGRGADKLSLQGDGNLVLYANGTALKAYSQAIPPDDKKGVRVVMQDDGNLAMYNAKGDCVWDTMHNAHVMQL